MTYYKRVFSKPCKYKGITFRSHLERDFAKYLDRNHIIWEYEKYKYELLSKEKYIDEITGKSHTLRNVIYIPDFYLPKYDLTIEIKGYPYDDRLFRLKIRLFKHKYPNRKIYIIKGRENFKNIKKVISLLENQIEKGE